MPRILECSFQDIQALGPLDLTRLLRKLLYLEARTAGIAASAVHTSLKIDVPDGGEDGRVAWQGGPASTDWLPSRFCLFQSKATDLTAAECKQELLRKGTNLLKPRVEEVLDAGGTYVLFLGRSCNTDQHPERIKKMREAIREAGKTYADSCDLVIRDANQIAAWATNHLSTVIEVFGLAQKPLPPSLENWQSWSRFREFSEFEYVAGDPARDGAVAQLRTHLRNSSKKAARLVGLSGLGKTRLALEVFRPPNDPASNFEQQALSDEVAYINAEEGSVDLLRVVHEWRTEGVRGILVVDNCNMELHQQLRRHVEHEDSNLSLLTIGPDPEVAAASTEEFPYIQIGPADDGVIAAMLKQHYSALAEADINFIVKEIARGFPQMAVLVAKARLERQEICETVDDSLLRRMLGAPPDAESPAFQVIRHCALFEQLGIKNAGADEYKWVSAFSKIDPDRFYEYVEQFKARGIITPHGNFVQVRPGPLAMRLAADWWRQCSPDKATRLIEGDIPDRLAEALCERIRVLDNIPAVRGFVESLCGEKRPFGQAKVLNSELGSRLFRSLVEANPEATANALNRAFADWTIDDLKNVGPGRRNLVWALEKLCFWKSTFSIAAPVLLFLAAAENEEWSNNSTGILLGLFKILLSGTQAEPNQRIALADFALAHSDDRCRILGARVLGSALATGRFIGRVGPEQQGSRFPEPEWRPKVYKEAFDYWAEALVRLGRLALQDDSVAEVAKHEISHHIRELTSAGRVNELNRVIVPIIEQCDGFWPAALEQVQHIKEYDWDRMPDDGKAMVEKWEKQLEPRHFDKRLILFVSEAPWESRKTDSGNFVDVAAAKASAFADEAAKDIDLLIPLLPKLLVGNQHQAYPFGNRLCQVLSDPTKIAFAAMDALSDIEPSKANPTFLTGMFAALYESHPALFESAFTYIEQQSKLRSHISRITRTSPLAQGYFERILSLVENGLLRPSELQGLSYGRGMDHLASEFVSQFCDRLVALGPEATWIALDILFMYAHGNSEKWISCRASFRQIVLTPNILLLDRSSQRFDVHAFGDVVTKLLNDGDVAVATHISSEIVEICRQEDFQYDLDHLLRPLVEILITKYLVVSWPILAGGLIEDWRTEFHLSHLLGSRFGMGEHPGLITKLDSEFLLNWCAADPSRHPVLLAKMVNMTDRSEGKSKALTPMTRHLIDRYGSSEDVLDALGVNLGTYSWTGSLVPYYEEQIALLSPLLDHEFSQVRDWASRRISYATEQAQRERDRDAEREIGLY